LLVQIHEEVAGLLGGRLPGGMQGDPQDADAPGRVLDYGKDMGLSAVEQADREEVARQDRLGLGAQELRPTRPALPGGVDAVGPGNTIRGGDQWAVRQRGSTRG